MQISTTISKKVSTRVMLENPSERVMSEATIYLELLRNRISSTEFPLLDLSPPSKFFILREEKKRRSPNIAACTTKLMELSDQESRSTETMNGLLSKSSTGSDMLKLRFQEEQPILFTLTLSRSSSPRL